MMEADHLKGLRSGVGTTAASATRMFELRGYCYDERGALLPLLSDAMTDCGGWMLEQRNVSSTAVECRFEIQLAGIVDFYACMVAMGLELTRGAHAILADLCTCRQYITRYVDPCQVLTLRLEIGFLADATLHSILMTGSGVA